MQLDVTGDGVHNKWVKFRALKHFWGYQRPLPATIFFVYGNFYIVANVRCLFHVIVLLRKMSKLINHGLTELNTTVKNGRVGGVRYPSLILRIVLCQANVKFVVG